MNTIIHDLLNSRRSYIHHAETRPLTADDIEPLLVHLPRESDRAAIRWRVLQDGPNTAFLIDDRVVAAGGFQMVHLGVGDPWLIVSPAGRVHFRPLYRAIVAWLLEQLAAHRMHRLQAGVRHDDTKAFILLGHLGFEYEGRMRQFGPDRADYDLLAWVRSD